MAENPGVPSGKYLRDPEQEIRGMISGLGDLSLKENQILLLQALSYRRHLAALDGEPNELEAAFWKLPKSTVRQIIATHCEAWEVERKLVAELMDRFQSGNVDKGGS